MRTETQRTKSSYGRQTADHNGPANGRIHRISDLPLGMTVDNMIPVSPSPKIKGTMRMFACSG